MEIKSVLHTISHSLNAPSHVFSHDHIDNQKHVNQVHSELKTGGHNYNHTHEVLNFLNSVFESASNTGDSQKGESTNIDFKIKKHITNAKYKLVFTTIKYIETSSYWIQNHFETKGYFNKLYRPPEA